MADHRTYGPGELHRLLYAEAGVGVDESTYTQALFCPYYVTLSDRLGADWGVVVNPESTRFTLLTFEHDPCGCPLDDSGFPVHGGGDQRPDGWLTGRKIRTCSEEDPCGQEWSDMTDAERANAARVRARNTPAV